MSDREAHRQYQSKVVVIHAVRWDGSNVDEVIDFAGLSGSFRRGAVGTNALFIETLEGTMRADKGDWIIRGLKGEYYPCKPDIFEAKYELATPTASPAPSAAIEMPRCNQGVPGILECSLPKGHSGPCSTEVDTPTAQAAPPADRSFEDGVEAGLELAVQWLNNPLNYRRYALDMIQQIRALKQED